MKTISPLTDKNGYIHRGAIIPPRWSQYSEQSEQSEQNLMMPTNEAAAPQGTAAMTDKMLSDLLAEGRIAVENLAFCVNSRVLRFALH